jgi:hypothetical protein
MNSTEGPIEQSIKGMVAAWSTPWELGAEVSGVLGQRSNMPDNESEAGDGNRTHGDDASGTRKRAVSCEG